MIYSVAEKTFSGKITINDLDDFEIRLFTSHVDFVECRLHDMHNSSL